jgi:very-short-patch-repair endonuclease
MRRGYCGQDSDSKQLGIAFSRQRVIGNYICDFVSIQNGMVIELDGGQHYSDKGVEYDKKRDEYIKSLGFEVLRFSNLEVKDNIDGVLQVILGRL